MSDDLNSGGGLSAIPEFYFDLIGRVVPGLILLTVTHWAATGEVVPIISQDHGFYVTSLVLAFCVAVSYVIGLSLNTLGPVFMAADALWQPGLLKSVRPEFHELLDIDGRLGRVCTPRAWRLAKRSVEDKAHKKYPDACRLLPKMMGEVSLFNVLSSGFAVLLLILQFTNLLRGVECELLRNTLWVLWAACTMAAGYRSWRFLVRICEYAK